MIKSYLPQNRMLKSTEHFMEKLKESKHNSKHNMVSFDVVSLFTNVPLTETIDIIIISHLYDENNDIAVILMYKGLFYKQIDGCIMVSPLGPTLANFFMAHLRVEQKFFSDKLNDPLLPQLYLR